MKTRIMETVGVMTDHLTNVIISGFTSTFLGLFLSAPTDLPTTTKICFVRATFYYIFIH